MSDPLLEAIPVSALNPSEAAMKAARRILICAGLHPSSEDAAIKLYGTIIDQEFAKAAPAGWQDIWTAPVNQSVLVWLPNREHYGDPVYRAILVDMGTGRRWTVTGLSMGRDIGGGEEPTHWQPLPQPPAPACRE